MTHLERVLHAFTAAVRRHRHSYRWHRVISTLAACASGLFVSHFAVNAQSVTPGVSASSTVAVAPTPLPGGADTSIRPYRIDVPEEALVDLRRRIAESGYLIGSQDANKKPLPPQAELQWWYQFYFATERGRAGYEAYRRDFAKLIWRIASPTWQFDDATFDRSAASLDNPDHVSIVIHNYRWRLGLAEGEPAYDALENRLAAAPVITVPTITLEGDANGAPHPAPAAYAAKFSGKYVHRNLTGGIGHNLPQEAPQAFAAAVIDADAL